MQNSGIGRELGRMGLDTFRRSKIVRVLARRCVPLDRLNAFEKEIKAYYYLEYAWGELVPEPRFLSFAFGVWFLGMQMARPPAENACMDDWGRELDELERKYKFRHLDIWNGERGDYGQNLMGRVVPG